MTPEEEELYWNDAKRCYFRIWTCALKILLGWPEQQTLEWATKWGDSLDEPTTRIFYHRPAEEWMAHELVPGRLRAKILQGGPGSGHDLLRLEWRLAYCIQDAIEGKQVEDYSDSDWRLIAERLDAILAEYGEELPRIEDAEPKQGLSQE
ncbi:MAG: hypothetical protein U0790_17225 [Isosphaeraceae bacterium]